MLDDREYSERSKQKGSVNPLGEHIELLFVLNFLLDDVENRKIDW